MYDNNVFSKRRPNGWAERRRRFERLTAQVNTKAGKPDEDRRDVAEKPKR